MAKTNFPGPNTYDGFDAWLGRKDRRKLSHMKFSVEPSAKYRAYRCSDCGESVIVEATEFLTGLLANHGEDVEERLIETLRLTAN